MHKAVHLKGIHRYSKCDIATTCTNYQKEPVKISSKSATDISVEDFFLSRNICNGQSYSTVLGKEGEVFIPVLQDSLSRFTSHHHRVSVETAIKTYIVARYVAAKVEIANKEQVPAKFIPEHKLPVVMYVYIKLPKLP